jgi:hypothetical protein
MPRFLDITGHRYGKLVVICRANDSMDRKVQWECACDCGSTKIIRGNSLRYGRTKSCGCLITTDSGPQVTIRRLRERIKELESLLGNG